MLHFAHQLVINCVYLLNLAGKVAHIEFYFSLCGKQLPADVNVERNKTTKLPDVRRR